MKIKCVIGILVAIVLLCQGVAFAESADNITAVAEETAVATDSANGTVGDTVMTDELAAPAVDPAAENVKDSKM